MKKVWVGVLLVVIWAGAYAQAPNIEVLSRLSYGQAYSVAYHDPYLYVLAGNSLLVLDITDNPDTPSIVSVVRFEARQAMGYGIAVNGDHLYAALHDYGYGIVDISDPTSPQITYMTPYPMRMLGAAVSGNYLYIAAVDSGIVVIDVSDPHNPNIIRTVPTTGPAVRPLVIDTLLFVAAADGGADVFSIADPSAPNFLTNISGGGGDVYSLFVHDTLAFLAAGRTGVMIYDISDLSTPTLLSVYDTRGSAYDVIVVDTLLFYADWRKGIGVLNIADPMNPIYLSGFDTDGYSRWLEVVGNRLYDADKNGGLKIFDISQPNSLTLSGIVATGGWVWCVASYDDYVYVSGWGQGLEYYDVSNLSNPQLIGCNRELLSRNMALGLGADENYVYVCGARDGFFIVDRNDPFNVIGALNTKSYAVKIVDTLAFVASATDGVTVINIADPANPSIISETPTNQYAYELDIKDTLLFVADKRAGLTIFDVADPANPVMISNIALSDSDNVYGIFVDDTIAYAADYNRGTPIVNVADPTSPFVITTIPPAHKARDVKKIGNYLFVAEEDSGLYVYNVQDPANPVYAAKLATGDAVWKMATLHDTLMILGARGSGVYIVHLQVINIEEDDSRSTSQGIMLMPNTVADGLLKIKLYSPAPVNVTLALYDISGRIVQNLVKNEQVNGRREFAFNLKGKVHSGIYILKGKVGGQAVSRKLLVVR